MKRVRSFSLKDEFERVVHAADFSPAERRRHNLRCLAPDCKAAFHYVRAYRHKENTDIVPATFARNPSSRHQPGCSFDYEAFARRHCTQSFMRNGEYHLRINFPMGGRYADRHPDIARLSAAQRAAANRNTDKKPARSLGQMLRFLESQFGSLRHAALENLKLSYQGRSAGWTDVFTPPEKYRRLLVEPGKPDNDALLTIVRPEKEDVPNESGKRRFLCEPQGGVRPVVVCENDAIAEAVRLTGTVMVAARPFRAQKPMTGNETRVSLYLHNEKQVAPVNSALFTPPKPRVQLSEQLKLFTV